MKYAELANDAVIETTVKNLTDHNFSVEVLNTKEEALAKIKEMIPAGASVMNGASKTLEQIGYIDYLKSGTHPWHNLHEKIVGEKDPVKQGLLRKQSVVSDYYLGSVHALTEEGEFIVASNTGSQLPHIVFTSQNVILVVSSKKITKDLTEGFKRLVEHVMPLEDARMKAAYGTGTNRSKTLIYHKERANSNRKINIMIVKEDLGF